MKWFKRELNIFNVDNVDDLNKLLKELKDTKVDVWYERMYDSYFLNEQIDDLCKNTAQFDSFKLLYDFVIDRYFKSEFKDKKLTELLK